LKTTQKLNHIPENNILELKPYLDAVGEKVENPDYIDSDPILFMHAFDDKLDQELAGFFAAIMAWGRRDIVINKVRDLLERMDHHPKEFIANFSEKDARFFRGFKHRTFKPVDIYWLVRILQRILHHYHGFEAFWEMCYRKALQSDRELMAVFHEEFFAIHPEVAQRTRKHISDADKNSSCKRLYLYLRWAVRKNSVVDLGIMDFIDESELMIPLDVHVARQARVLGLLTRTYNDWKAVQELTERLRILDPDDPVRYDYALFGMGVRDIDIPEEFIINPEYINSN